MADFHIYVGYRTVSSWSLRGWLPMKKAGVPFEETLVRYRSPAGRAELDRLSKAQGVAVAWLIRRAVERYLEDAAGGPMLPLGGTEDAKR